MKQSAKNRTGIFFALAFCVACSRSERSYFAEHLRRDFWLVSAPGDTAKLLVRSQEADGNGGAMVIDKRITFCKSSDDFIVAVQYPDLREVISRRLFSVKNEKGHFLIRETSDTIYLSDEDSIYMDDGKYYHTLSGWNPPDSLAVQHAVFYYYIVDIRPEANGGKPYQVYKLFTREDFDQRSAVLMLPDSLKPEVQ